MKGYYRILIMLLFLMIGSIINVSATDIVRTFHYNKSQVPLNDSTFYMFSLSNSTEIYIVQNRSDNYSKFYYNDTLYIDNQSTQANVSIRWNIFYTLNESWLSYDFIITNNLTNSTTYLYINFNITDDTLETFYNETNPYLNYDGTGLERIFYLYDTLLDKNLTISYQNINIRYNTTLNFYCGSFIECPRNFTMLDITNKTTVTVSIFVPNGTGLGWHYSYINFSVPEANKSIMSNITFQVSHLDQINTQIQYYAQSDRCSQCYTIINVTDKLTCLLECNNENLKLNSLLQEQIQRMLDGQPLPQCPNITTTEYVIAGSASSECKIAFDQNRELRSQRDTYEADKEGVQRELDKCKIDLVEERANLLEEKENMTKELLLKNYEIDQKAIDNERNQKNIVWHWFWILLIGGLVVGVFVYAYKTINGRGFAW